MKKHTKFALSLILAMLAAMLVFALPTLAETEETNRIESILLDKNNTTVVLELRLTKDYVKEHKSSTLGLFELHPWQSTSQINQLVPIETFKPTEKNTLRIDYVVGNMNRLFSKFVVAEQLSDGTYEIITTAKYIENLTNLAENTEPYPETDSKKGLQVQMFTDAQELGVRHAVISVELNEYIVGESSESSVSYLFGGETYYIDKSKLSLLDHRIKTYSEAGINIYLNFILTEPTADLSSVVWSFYSENRTPGAASYALNMRNEIAMKNFTAFTDYIAERYTRPDRAYGFAGNFIVGFEVNDGRTRNNAGPTDLASSVYSYCTAFRVAYSALSSHYSNGRVYISLGNSFATGAQSPDLPEDPTLDFGAKAYLDFFAAAIENSGDIPWGVSINPYPSDKALTEFWNDGYAKNELDTPYLTMKNLEVLTEYMHTPAMLYGENEVRSIIVGEFGVGGDPLDDASLAMQSAAYALAFAKATLNKDIDAFIWHRHVDYQSSEGLAYGLWTSLDGNVLYPQSKKPIHGTFAGVDTSDAESIYSHVKSTVGNGTYSLFLPDDTDFDKFSARNELAVELADSEEHKKGYNETVILDLTKGVICGFYPSDNAQYVELRQPEGAENSMLFTRLAGVPTEYSGIGTVELPEEALKNAHYIKLKLMVSAPAETAGIELAMRLMSDGKSGESVLVGEALISPNQMQELSFNVKDFAKLTGGELDLFKLWIKAPEGLGADGEYGIWLEDVTVYSKNPFGFIGVLLWILLVLVLLAVAGYIALYIRAELIRRRRREARRRAQLAAQARNAQLMRMNGMQNTQTMQAMNNTQPINRPYPPQPNQPRREDINSDNNNQPRR